MKAFIYAPIALDSLSAHKLRSLLAILGIVIGVAAVIAVVSIGEGNKNKIQQEINKIGTDIFWIKPNLAQFTKPDGLRAFTSMERRSLRYSDIEAFSIYCPKIKATAAAIEFNGSILFQSKEAQGLVVATEPAFSAIRRLELLEGRFITPTDVRHRRKVCVIEYSDHFRRLLAGSFPLQCSFFFNGVDWQIVGIIKERDDRLERQTNTIYIPLTSVDYIYGRHEIETVYCWVEGDNVDEAMQQSEAILQSRYQGRDYFKAVNAKALFRSAQKLTRTATLVTAGIAAISLLVGGIGVMNIMLVSTTERTKEIGTRKAVGARKRDILGQFLIEAVVLTFMGGTLGIPVGILLANLMVPFLKILFVFSKLAIIIGFLFSVVIGIISGFYPAHKAANFSPVEAIRYE